MSLLVVTIMSEMRTMEATLFSSLLTKRFGRSIRKIGT